MVGKDVPTPERIPCPGKNESNSIKVSSDRCKPAMAHVPPTLPPIHNTHRHTTEIIILRERTREVAQQIKSLATHQAR